MLLCKPWSCSAQTFTSGTSALRKLLTSILLHLSPSVLRQDGPAQQTGGQHMDTDNNQLTTPEEILAAAACQLAMKPAVFAGLLRHLAHLEATDSLPQSLPPWIELLTEYGGFISMSQAKSLYDCVFKGWSFGAAALVMFLVVDRVPDTSETVHDTLTHGCFQGNVVQNSWWPLLRSAIAAAHPKIAASTASAFYVRWLFEQEVSIRRSFSGSTDAPTFHGGSYQAMFNAVIAAARQHFIVSWCS